MTGAANMNTRIPINRDGNIKTGELLSGKCILIGAGDLTIDELPITSDDFVIAVDGGYLYCKLLGVVPDLYLGDFDSLEQKEKSEIMQIAMQMPEKVIELSPIKDDTDMLAALKEGLRRGFKEFRIYAGMGGRLEHTLANIQCLNYLKEQGAVGYLMSSEEMLLLAKEECLSFQGNLEGYLSIFALGNEAKGVTLENLKYPLLDYTVTNAFPIGVSNEFIGKKASVTVKEGTLLIIIRWA